MPNADCCKRVVLKLIQIGLNVICVGLILKYNCVPTMGKGFLSIETDTTRVYLAVAVVGGYLVVSTVILLAYAFEGIGKAPITEALLMAVGGGLAIAAGGLTLDTFINYQKGDTDYHKAGLAFGSLLVVNGLVYLIDAFVGFKHKL